MRLLIDANLSPRVAARLGDGGHDVRHVVDVGLGSASDMEILEWALAENRVIVSSDSDFGAILAGLNSTKPSFVLLRHLNQLTPAEQADLLLANLPAMEDELRAGAVVTFLRDRIRVRSLPFRPI